MSEDIIKRISDILDVYGNPNEQKPLILSLVQEIADKGKKLEDDRFWQAFCAALSGLRANPQIRVFDPETKETVSSNESIEIYVGLAIEYAQEALRQVGELTKCPACKKSYCDCAELQSAGFNKEQADGA